MKNKSVIFLTLAFLLLLGGAYLLYGWLSQGQDPNTLTVIPSQSQPEADVIPEPEVNADPDATLAPDFTVYDKQGNPVKLSDFKGKPIVLNFWASWCGPCKSEMPDFEKAYKELGGRVQFLMVNATDGYQETMDSASAYIESTGYTFPVFYDTQQTALNAYGIYAFPTTFFINEKGELVVYAVSALSADLLQQGLDMILPKE